MLVYSKATRIACERFKGPLFCISTYILFTVSVTVQETDAQHDYLVQLQSVSPRNVCCNRSASKQQSSGQREKPKLNAKINTKTVTRLQILEVYIFIVAETKHIGSLKLRWKEI